ncbi:hypothetical protein ACHAWU_007055 [Discostella pseudostelligera]|uniref:Uncharacterized protein n=1 Tax=Discostella pseudostelligera TaxID=259834 RepID=A0ABD3MBC3_9STRA
MVSSSYRRAILQSAVLVTIVFLIHMSHDLSNNNDNIYNNNLDTHEIKSISSTVTESMPTTNGYSNLSCPFEMSKFSCIYMHQGVNHQVAAHASMDYYRQHLEMIGETFRQVLFEDSHTTTTTTRRSNKRRILLSGDSLLRQIFISIACNAHSILPNTTLIQDAVIPWQDPWPIVYGPNNFPSIGGGVHGGFGSASIRLVNGMELHYVPHRGYNSDPTAGEPMIIQRLKEDIANYNGRITFGTKTAMPLSIDDHVDVLVFQVGIHYGLGESKTVLNHFANWISRPLMSVTGNNKDNNILHDGYETLHGGNNNDSIEQPPSRTRTIYITTPSQHFNTTNGQWEIMSMTPQSKKCIPGITSNPRADQEKKMLKPGVNGDVLLDYDDLQFGTMHVQYGDCSHYCMPGVPDGVATRLMQELLLV